MQKPMNADLTVSVNNLIRELGKRSLIEMLSIFKLRDVREEEEGRREG